MLSLALAVAQVVNVFIVASDLTPLSSAEVWGADQNGCQLLSLWSSSALDKTSVNWSGACVSGHAEGVGVAQWYHGERKGATFTGTLQGGRPQGEGALELSGGDHYQGSFDRGLLSGAGEYRWAHGDHYVGEFAGGVLAGSGSYRFADGTRYEGSFVNGQPADRNLLDTTAAFRLLGQPRSLQAMAGLSIRSPSLGHLVCTRMGKPGPVPVHWSGSLTFVATTEVRSGRVHSVKVRSLNADLAAGLGARFADELRRTITETYQCQGDQVFEQTFRFTMGPLAVKVR